MTDEPYDLVGVGIGPFNLSLAALAEPVADLRAAFLEAGQAFRWHPGMMVDGATLQVPFLADLVTLVDPTSRHSFLAHLRDTGRLFGFYFAEQLHVPRIEYESYCAAVAARLDACRFGTRVAEVDRTSLPDGRDGFAVTFEHQADDEAQDAPRRSTLTAANLVLGIGTEPVVPTALSRLTEPPGAAAFHSAHYLRHAAQLGTAEDVTVIGSGQSGAEIVLDLLRSWHRPGRRLRWLTRSAAFEPMEYSKLGLEHFTPDYIDHFHALPEERRDALLAGQGRLYKAVSADTLAAVRAELDALAYAHGIASTGTTLMPGVEILEGLREGGKLNVTLRHVQTGRPFALTTDRLILATGYAQRRPDFLAPLDHLIPRDGRGRPVVERDHRIPLRGHDAGLYVQNAELHTHGVGTPDLGLGAYRAARILNHVAGREVYPLPARTAHTAFTPAVAAAADPGITLADQEQHDGR